MLLLRARPHVERILVNDDLFPKIAELRYRVYVEEKGFLESDKYQHRRESDEYDGQSIHVVVLIGRRLAGYARVILPAEKALPIFEHFELPEEKDMGHSCEVSRFMIAKAYRRKQETRREIFRLLAEEILKIVKENDVKNIYAVVEDWLLKSLKKRGYDFVEIGSPSNEYMNTMNYPVRLKL
ncbi:MAG: GNAT family N-acetyltransferase [Candidatus Berkelbacteria bacterium]|nr:MAG: GNAT family N-acetyltransferase [Candidatus Berkelbacteria bacterium]QQG51589.1 MAG: GNAT family N-acetyltransferase [Candidatus Berkelbacteria bacterium]